MPSSSRRLSRTTSTVDEEAESEAKPVATFESKNSLTKQTVQDAVEQYMRDRDAREKLFEFGRCVVHFAVDDHEVRFFTHLKDKFSWFLPFNLGWNDGAGNPPNQDGLKTDYLWRRILTRDGLTDILENYAQVVEARDEKTGKKKAVQIWPRLHQLDVVRKLLADAGRHGAGRRYLIQHSNIPWTDADRVHRLITRTSRIASPRTRPIRTRDRTRTNRTPASSTTRRLPVS